jgi:HTH-type transcriptional regulator / antitoxin HipB
MDDFDRYLLERDAREPGFAKAFRRESAAFRAGVMLQVAREAAGMTQQQVADLMGTKKSAISRIEHNAGGIRLSTLQRYAEAVGHRLVIELQQEEGVKPAGVRKPRRSRKLVTADSPS